jgi:hypothetical protein
MSSMSIVRTGAPMPEGRALDAARDLLFGAIDGLGEKDKKAWRRLWRRLTRAEPGEVVEVETVFPRSGKFHRFHMRIEHAVFQAQERFENFEQFRYWLKVGAGWVTWAAGPKGGVVPVPNSISYAKADEHEFREYHEQALAFLRGPHAAKYLWPHLSPEAQAEMIEQLIAGAS